MTTVTAPAATAGVQRPARLSSRSRSLIITAVAYVLVLIGWEALARTVFEGQYLIGSPTGIVAALGDNTGLYWRALRVTLGQAAWGFLWGNLAAVALAAFVAVAPPVERVVLRLGLVVYCLPLVAIGPLLRVVFGTGTGPQITLAAFAVFYTTLIPLLVGLRAVPANWLEMVSTYGRGRFTKLLVVRARASVPYLAGGLQIAVPAAFLGSLVGEFTGAERGMGILTIQALRSLNTEGLWALATISAVVSVTGYWFAGWLGRKLTVEQPPVLLTPPPVVTGRRSLPVRAALTVFEVAVTLAIVLGSWVGLIRLFDLNPFFAKTPADVWTWLFTAPTAEANRQVIIDALSGTAWVAIPGYVAGLLLGAVLAALFELKPAVRRTVTPLTVALRCVPIVAIAPLLVRSLGRGAIGTIITVALMSFFTTLIACSQGLRQTPGQVMDFFRVYRTSPTRTLALAQVPAMMPAFFAAARLAVPASILAATVAEWLATGTGMGNLMAVAATNNEYALLWSATVVLTTIAAIAYAAIAAVERVVMRRVAPEQVSW